ncbi:hypothetical protein BD410DRAFT_816777 [Rickenella mellea]|uniref:TECPR1-like DysF domain-containing protein n=1 Tax=Rickenella mellea TaxID=50990 RepID=A0A4Y7PNS6_9AGAM|nr:hypothetical protein BD410DRAFT_816777 [Rickenella mellea]
MESFDYIEIPSCAARLSSAALSGSFRPAQKVASSPPQVAETSLETSSQEWRTPPPKERKHPFNIASAILSTGLRLDIPTPSNPRVSPRLLSSREPLSLPLTTANFRRFAAKSGPIFWLQDRIEEVLMWRNGWKVTAAWMAGYAFLCYFPRLILLIPHTILLTILLSAHSSLQPSPSIQPETPSSPIADQQPEGSSGWYSNLQAVQNLMGATSDAHDFVMTFVPHLTYSTPYTYTILTVTVVSMLMLLPIIYILPLRPTFLVLGLTPFALTHPTSQRILPALLSPFRKRAITAFIRFTDDDRLAEHHWKNGASLREVELWENERATPGSGVPVWSKAALKDSERKAWTRGRDGWSGGDAQGSLEGGDVSSTLTFALSPGWAFVETEDWRKDLEATWIDVDSDDDGWIYTNDAWLDPHSMPLEEWKANGATRRRRWTRLIYSSSSLKS